MMQVEGSGTGIGAPARVARLMLVGAERASRGRRAKVRILACIFVGEVVLCDMRV
jgi:hypothetical protein